MEIEDISKMDSETMLCSVSYDDSDETDMDEDDPDFRTSRKIAVDSCRVIVDKYQCVKRNLSVSTNKGECEAIDETIKGQSDDDGDDANGSLDYGLFLSNEEFYSVSMNYIYLYFIDICLGVTFVILKKFLLTESSNKE